MDRRWRGRERREERGWKGLGGRQERICVAMGAGKTSAGVCRSLTECRVTEGRGMAISERWLVISFRGSRLPAKSTDEDIGPILRLSSIGSNRRFLINGFSAKSSFYWEVTENLIFPIFVYSNILE